jgi:hypothetical protein
MTLMYARPGSLCLFVIVTNQCHQRDLTRHERAAEHTYQERSLGIRIQQLQQTEEAKSKLVHLTVSTCLHLPLLAP